MCLSRVCVFAAIISFVVGICCVFVLWSVPLATPTAFQVFCERLLRPGEVLSTALLPAEYGQIICESTPPPHARSVAVVATVLLNSAFWTVLVATVFLVTRLFRRRRHATQTI
jgi:hypothetical protein